MTATGNEAVSLSQLKQYSQTLGGGSDIQRQTLTLANGSSHNFGNWYFLSFGEYFYNSGCRISRQYDIKFVCQIKYLYFG